MKGYYNCYASDAKKILEILDQKKVSGYIITQIDFVDGMVEAVFEKTTKEFVYSIDYSKEKYKDMDINNEYFDTAKLNGWKLQCFDDNVGIWINDNAEDAIPFFLPDEYSAFESKASKKRLKSIKITMISNTCLLMLSIYHYFVRGGKNIFYGLPFVILYYYCVYGVLKKKKDYPKIVIETISTNFICTQYILIDFNLRFVIILDILLFISSIILLSKNNLNAKVLLIKMTSILWVILFIVYMIFGG